MIDLRLINCVLSLLVVAVFMFRLTHDWRDLAPLIRATIASQIAVFCIFAYGSLRLRALGAPTPEYLPYAVVALLSLLVALVLPGRRR